jgi:outer membrane lipoprotein SlyB
MSRILLLLAALPLTVAACTPTDQATAIGALGGAAVGAAVSGDGDKTKGAVVGAIVGATAANLLGPAASPGQCRYVDQYGNEYIAACP